MDIWYILTSATTLGWRQEHLEEATEFYYDHLYASLDKLGYSPDKVFPMEAFKRQLDHCYGVGYICGNLLVMVRIMILKIMHICGHSPYHYLLNPGLPASF